MVSKSFSLPSINTNHTITVAKINSCEVHLKKKKKKRPGGSVVSVSDSWPGVCEFDPRLRRLFFPAYFRLSPMQKHVRKVVGCFGKKGIISTGAIKAGNTCVTYRHDTLTVKVA